MSEPPRILPRSRIAIGVHPRLRGALAGMARGRSLVIGYFASARCGTVIGDLSVDWRSMPPGGRFRRLAPIEGVDVFADARLLEVLEVAEPELQPGSIIRPGTPALSLGVPERWIDFLDSPAALQRGRRHERS